MCKSMISHAEFCCVSKGLLHAGIGTTAKDNFSTTLNCPVHHEALKRGEREVGVVVLSAAKQRCKKKIVEERRLSDPTSGDNIVL